MRRSLLLLFVLSSLSGGIDYNYTGLGISTRHFRLDDSKLTLDRATVTWMYVKKNEFYGDFGIGLNDSELRPFSDQNLRLESSNEVTWYINHFRNYKYFTVGGGIHYYKLTGDVRHPADPESGNFFKDKNTYSIFELPLGVGLQFEHPRFRSRLGLGKSLFYGSKTCTQYLVQESIPIELFKSDATFNDVSILYSEFETSLFLSPRFSVTYSIRYGDKEIQAQTLNLGTSIGR